MSAADRLDAAELRAALGPCVIGRDIFVLQQTTSTNDRVREYAMDGREEGVVVFTEEQTAGRGQHGNRWESAAGKGLWFSVLLRPRLELRASSELTAWLARAVAATLTQAAAVRVQVKPPNDVYIDGRKVAGVLVEMRAMPEGNYAAIAGIGVNVNQDSADFSDDIRARAGSLALAAGKSFSRFELAVALLRELDASYRDAFAPKS